MLDGKSQSIAREEILFNEIQQGDLTSAPLRLHRRTHSPHDRVDRLLLSPADSGDIYASNSSNLGLPAVDELPPLKESDISSFEESKTSQHGRLPYSPMSNRKESTGATYDLVDAYLRRRRIQRESFGRPVANDQPLNYQLRKGGVLATFAKMVVGGRRAWKLWAAEIFFDLSMVGRYEIDEQIFANPPCYSNFKHYVKFCHALLGMFQYHCNQEQRSVGLLLARFFIFCPSLFATVFQWLCNRAQNRICNPSGFPSNVQTSFTSVGGGDIR